MDCTGATPHLLVSSLGGLVSGPFLPMLQRDKRSIVGGALKSLARSFESPVIRRLEVCRSCLLAMIYTSRAALVRSKPKCRKVPGAPSGSRRLRLIDLTANGNECEV